MPIRRRALAAFPLLLAHRPARAASPYQAGVESILARTLPPGLDPRALGRVMRAGHPTCTRADCHARAALPTLAALPSAIAADFAAGHTVTIDGWLLSRTEAWLCATLA